MASRHRCFLREAWRTEVPLESVSDSVVLRHSPMAYGERSIEQLATSRPPSSSGDGRLRLARVSSMHAPIPSSPSRHNVQLRDESNARRVLSSAFQERRSAVEMIPETPRPNSPLSP